MKTLDRWIRKYLVYVAPVVLLTILWGGFQPDIANDSTTLGTLYDIASWALVLWFALLFFFSVLLAFRRETQEATVKYLAGIKERDERELAVMGAAARRTFTATTGLLVFLLFLSTMTVHIARRPNSQVTDGKHHTLSLGFGFSPTSHERAHNADGSIIFEHYDLPLSKSALLMMILIWHVGSFRLRAKRELGGYQ